MTAPAHEWSGMYRGDIAGTPATLQLTEAGGGLHGVIDAGGYRYLLQVRAAGTTASGTFQDPQAGGTGRSEEHTSELQSLMRISYAVFCLKKNNKNKLKIRQKT